MVRLFFVMIAGFGVGLVALMAGFGSGAFLTYELMQPFDLEGQKINYQMLDFPSSQSKAYLTARRWGLTGDSEEVRICDAPINFRKEAGNCLVFYTDELFYGREENKLVVHANTFAVPNGDPSRLGTMDVEVHQLNYDKNEAMRRDYDKRGLMRIYAP